MTSIEIIPQNKNDLSILNLLIPRIIYQVCAEVLGQEVKKCYSVEFLFHKWKRQV